jgi:hypothetical protein
MFIVFGYVIHNIINKIISKKIYYILMENFLYSNFHLFIILGLDFITNLNLKFYSDSLSIEDTISLVKFNNLCGIFIYLLSPLKNISLELAKSNLSILNLIIFNTLLIFFFSIVIKLLFCLDKDLLNNDLNNFFLIFFNLLVHSILSIFSYFLNGHKKISILLIFNIFLMVYNYILIHKIIIHCSLFYKILFLNFGDLFCILYVISKIDNLLILDKINYYDCIKLIVNNSISAISININNNITSNLIGYQIKKYNSMSSHLNTYSLLYSPVSLIIKKGDIKQNLLIRLLIIYYLIFLIIYNTFSKFEIISNIYLLLNYLVLILDSYTILDITDGIRVNIIIILGKLLYKNIIKISNNNNYYNFVNIFYLIKILLKLNNLYNND